MKKLFKIIGLLVLAVALSVGASALIARSTNNYSEAPNLTNEDNLVHTLEEYVSATGSFANGLTIKENASGSIVLDGTYSDSNTEDYIFTLGTVTVEEEDYYTLSGASRGSLETFYIMATYEDASGNAKTLISDFSDTMTSSDKLPVGTQVTISIVIKPGTDFNYYTVKPTFVAGEEAGKF